MKEVTFKVPLREDFDLLFIISEGDDIEEIADKYGDTDDDLYPDKDGWYELVNDEFRICIINGGLNTLVHECNHFAFGWCDRFAVHSKELCCMLTEWAFEKGKDLVVK